VRRALILLALALVAAGCGGGGGGGSAKGTPLTKAEYQAKLEQTSKDIARELGGPQQSDISKLTDKDVRQLVDALHSFADRLSAIEPPAEVADLHAQLIQAMNDVGDEFPDIAKKLKATKDPSAAIAALFGAKGVQELIKVGDAFKKKGYNLDLNG
jgi:hypothetical protein